MPTGYTDIIGKENTTLRDYALRCMRAFMFGMRDEPIDSPIPDKFEPSTYHSDALKEAKVKLQKLSKIGMAACERASEENYNKSMKAHTEYLQEKGNLLRKYKDMQIKVEKWSPPKSCRALKTFMIEQIVQSIEHDCSTKYDDEMRPKYLTGGEWYRKQITDIKRDVKYHTEEIKKEKEYYLKTNKFIKDLRESLE